MKILITGGAGYIGSLLTGFLLDEGYEVSVVDNFMYNDQSLNSYFANPKFKVHKIDVRDFEKIKKLIKNFDIIIPLSALVGAPLCNFKKDDANSINFSSIKNIVDNLSKEQKIIYPTTNSGYGVGKSQDYCTEDSPLNPISLYGTTKVKAENYVSNFENHISFRLATVFGASPRMRLDLLVNDFVYRAYKDGFIVLFKSHFKRNYIHIRDVCRAFVFAIKNFDKMKNDVYNLGLSEANYTKKELCEVIKTKIKNFEIYKSNIGQDIDKRDYIVSNRKIEKKGFKATINVLTGIDELLKLYSVFLPNQNMRNF